MPKSRVARAHACSETMLSAVTFPDNAGCLIGNPAVVEAGCVREGDFSVDKPSVRATMARPSLPEGGRRGGDELVIRSSSSR